MTLLPRTKAPQPTVAPLMTLPLRVGDAARGVPFTGSTTGVGARDVGRGANDGAESDGAGPVGSGRTRSGLSAAELAAATGVGVDAVPALCVHADIATALTAETVALPGWLA